MNKKIASIIIVLISFIMIHGCKCKEKAAQAGEATIKTESIPDEKIGGQAAMQPTLVYKTNNDYSKNVPVMMNADKTDIISYPAPTDVYFRGTLAYPTQLENGYLLDNRGIGPNVAFLDYTYEAYSALKQAPDKKTLLERIIDKNPLVELWNCGPRYQEKNETDFLNELIGKKFPNCKRLITIYRVSLEQ